MFPAHDELRIKRLPTGYLTELCKDGEVHTRLFDTFDGPPGAKKVTQQLVEQIEPRPCP
jgi:hypothetical protein